MEDNKTGSTSDRDKKMMGSFESYADKKEREEKEKAEKKRLRAFPTLFEQITEDEKAEKEDEKKPTDLGELFAPKPEAKEESETETEDEEEEKPAEAEPETPEAVEQPETAEVEKPVDELTEDETQLAIDRYAEARKEEVEEETEVRLLENMQETGSVEEGYAATLEEFDLDESDLEDTEEVEEDEEAEPVDDELEEAPESLEDAEDEAEDDDSAAVPPTPPVPPSPPTPPLPPNPAPYMYPQPQPGIPSLNAAPTTATAASANRLGSQFNADPSKKYQRGADMLVGGLIGYLLGRRRGRIKTEAELLPIQNKLEKQVGKLYEDIAERETKIRKLVALKAEQQADTEPLARRVEDEDRQEAMTRRSFESVTRTNYQNVNPEQLGRFVVPPVELAAERAPETANLTLNELLAIAANIKRDEVSLKQMFENGRLDAEGLRRAIHEYLHGDHFERVLTENLKNVERYEQDPLRSGSSDTGQSGVSTPGSFGGGEFGLSDGLQPLGDRQPSQPLAGSAPSYYYPSGNSRRQAATTGVIIGFVVAVVVLIMLALFA